ncbi:putative membrane protein [[Clostridium] bifermentans ATCC 19299]|uniref:ATP-binding protein n=1 Tax=Paraclostridium bifermentans TaxID=1490 RepID=A0A5P3XH01_PARBF|nr:ATP-binding protein [Paraclostridium bifermentans]EQK48661.1 putative membrane protein [[Clostridium] bifermentans ATCC 19299] [Paraclostridium bifermentans ATCC 19299]MDV8113644.1 ATP-binding protein [Bacillus sp. BAU-SS-2023]QEZ69455.1 ATP-binding protein [Paraclostridium bifermentans]QEZ69582.1 ATP-binding protein [Paraclostridium bifermentans]
MLESNLFWIFTTMVSGIVEWIVFKLILDEISIVKNNKITVYIELILAITTITILNLYQLNPNIKLLIDVTMGFIFYKLNYEVKVIKCLIIILIYYMILIGLDAIGSSVIVVLNSLKDMNELLNNNLFRLELIILTKSLLLSAIPIINTFKVKMKIRKQDYIYIIIPILSNIISIIVIFKFMFKDKDIDDIEGIMILIISIVLFLSNLVLASIIARIIKDNNLRAENKIINEKVELQYKYYLKLNETQLRTRKLYHDMKNHIICIEKICGNNETANKYIKEMNNQIKECTYQFNTGNIILDTILYEKKSICIEKNIKFLVNINFNNCNFIEMVDICSIFSNMIDNSIEACNKINNKDVKKEIKLSGTIVNKFFVIKCENSKVNDIKLRENKILTDKKDSFLHGIGISSIKSSVEKYNGNTEISLTEKKFIMTIFIPLVKNKNQLGL